MSIERYRADLTTAKERVSFDKLKSLRGLIFGSRGMQFDAFLRQVPTSEELTALAEQARKPEILHAILDLDGTLVPPYAPISDDETAKLNEYQEDDRNVAIYTNSPHSDRLNVLRQNGIAIAQTGIGKPSLEGFQRLCDAKKMDPAHTAMIGNFPITDMPLVKDGESPFFPLNVLVESIPPQRELVDSWPKYLRARLFHAMNTATANIVQSRNPDMIYEIEKQADAPTPSTSYRLLGSMREQGFAEASFVINDGVQAEEYRVLIRKLRRRRLPYELVEVDSMMFVFTSDESPGSTAK